MGDIETLEPSQVDTEGASEPIRGLLLVFSHETPLYRLMPLVPGVRHLVGRDDVGGVGVPDLRLGRQHAEFVWDGSPNDGAVVTVHDNESTNGTFVDGVRVPSGGALRAKVGSVIRLARTLLVVSADLRRYYAGHVDVSEHGVVGPTLRQTLDKVASAGRLGGHLVVRGATGTGKERCAELFHAAGGGKGPFVAVNCASIPSELAESLFFGTLSGVATNVEKRDGYLVAANGGTLFLDEVVEMSLAVQAMLLRAIETGEVLPVGATAPKRVSFRVVVASHQELRGAVESGKFRSDLFYRLAQREVVLPTVKERPEDVPWLMQYFTRDFRGLSLHVSAVEAVLRREWGGNVRELAAAMKAAGATAMEANSAALRDEHLPSEAGRVMQPSARALVQTVAARPSALAAATGAGPQRPASAEVLLAALEGARGVVADAAVALGLPRTNRTQFVRWRDSFGIPSCEQLEKALDEARWNLAAAAKGLSLRPELDLARIVRAYHLVPPQPSRTLDEGEPDDGGEPSPQGSPNT